MRNQNWQSMVSVVIPVLNEEQAIGKVVELVKHSKLVDEVIVVDDKSIDNTIREAKLAGAKVITSTKIGKGASMRDGLLVSKNDILLYLDGDVENYSPDAVEKMALPILDDRADFVKSSFSREAGRVTELVAKPLLSLLFPELVKFSQPLSGMIAGRKMFFQKLQFEEDYGVDIGILIDMHHLGARIVEVDIGAIEHKMKPWHQLGRMSREVSKAILRRVTGQSLTTLDTLGTISIITDQMEYAIRETVAGLKKMALFDMDNTILMGRFIEKASQRFGFEKGLADIRANTKETFLATKQIAKLLKSKDISALLSIAEEISLVPDAIEVIQELKKRGYIIGIISDSYDCIANHIKNKVGADFALANELEFSQSIATGEVKIPSFYTKSDGSRCVHPICKSNALLQVSEQYGIHLSNIIYVGDSEYDICPVRMAGIGVAFCSNNDFLNFAADERIKVRSFKPILDFA